jgi:hypothetical protein
LNGNVAGAKTTLANAESAVTTFQGTISTATATVVADLQAEPYNGSALVPDPNSTANPPTDYLLLTLTSSTPPGLAQQAVPLAT